VTINLAEQVGVLISADSHVTELPQVWKGLLPADFWGNATGLTQTRGTDPSKRWDEVKIDGIGAEVLYPTLGLAVLSIADPGLQEACCHAYNEWLVEYCKADPERLVGIGLVSCYRPEAAISELRYCHEHGLRGAMVWETPPADLPFTSFHYDPIWAEAQRLGLPINVHILTGFNYSRHKGKEEAPKDPRIARISGYHGSVNEKLACTADTLFNFIFSGVFERFPDLRLAIVENELSWLPFYVDQWDYYYQRYLTTRTLEDISKPPSEYIDNQVFVTFFRDPLAGHVLSKWGAKNAMWSNDYPHGNSTWPESQKYVNDQLGYLDKETQDQVLRTNCIDLYRLNAGVVLKQA
jgi:predicted TIM-barrel fold metal-dependent hydrolase